MAEEEGAPDVFVKNDDAFNHTTSLLGGVAKTFGGAISGPIGETKAPAGAGQMPEGQELMKNLGTAGELLATFLTTVSDGLLGYRTAVAAIGNEYNRLVVLNNQRLHSVLRPHEGPVPRVDPVV